MISNIEFISFTKQIFLSVFMLELEGKFIIRNGLFIIIYY